MKAAILWPLSMLSDKHLSSGLFLVFPDVIDINIRSLLFNHINDVTHQIINDFGTFFGCGDIDLAESTPAIDGLYFQ